MQNKKLSDHYFTKGELLLFFSSVVLILVSFLLFDRKNFMMLAASLIGAASLIFSAKGNFIGPLLMIIFSVLYGIISYSYSYYGEMITYLGMTAPMSVSALISWLKNPYNGNIAEVSVNRLQKMERIFAAFLTAGVTVLFYFILRALHTANLLPSTLSVTTSFLAVYLTFRRSPYYALSYAANDMILIILWVLAARTDSGYWSVAVCFMMFLANDIYGFINWSRMRRRQFSEINIEIQKNHERADDPDNRL